MDGVLNLYKPKGITSFGAIRRIKQISGEKKIGHLGTLDPMAEGVLPLFLGKATKLIPYLNQSDKTYLAEVTLGLTSDTLDREGETRTWEIPPEVDAAQVRKVLQTFVGEISQVPPMYSALKQKGKKLYELARQGIEVQREPRQVTIHSLEEIEVHLPVLRFSVHCSKGTYIRSLADDLGKALGTRGILTALTRSACQGGFSMDSSVRLDQIENIDHATLLRFLLDPTRLFPDWTQVEVIEPSRLESLLQGRKIPLPEVAPRFKLKNSAPCLLKRNREILALGHLEFSQDAPVLFQPERVLLTR